MRKFFCLTLCMAFLALPMSGCMTLNHTVGTGGTGDRAVASQQQWYILWGLVPLGKVDGGELAKSKGVTNNYTVKSQISFVDGLVNILTGIVTVYHQTVTVEK